MEDASKKINVLVCGTRFGKFYVEAIKRRTKGMRLVGIMTRGSEKSKRYAEMLHTALYTTIEEVPVTELNFVCIAVKTSIMGGEGTELALEFLERGVSVVLEQPVHSRDIVKCVKIAAKNKVFFIVGNLYKNTGSVNNYIAILKKLVKLDRPLYLEMKLATQVSYPAAALLNTIIENRKLSFENTAITINKGFSVLKGYSESLPVILFADNRADPQNADTHLPLFYQFNVGFNSGNLTLPEAFSNTLWLPAMSIENERDGVQKLPFEMKRNLMDETTNRLTAGPIHTFAEIFEKDWPEAIALDLDKMCSFLKGDNYDEYNTYIRNEINAAETWQKIMGNYGYPELKNNDDYVHIDTESIKSRRGEDERTGFI